MYGLAGFMMGAKAGGASVQLGYGYEMELSQLVLSVVYL